LPKLFCRASAHSGSAASSRSSSADCSDGYRRARLRHSVAFIAGLALVSAALILAVGGLAAGSRRRAVVSGREALIGSVGVVTVATADGTWAQVQGGILARRRDRPLAPGDRVRVTGLSGLTLQVEPLAADGRASKRSSP